jgi:Zn-dependent protease with chaperone function
MMFLLFGTAVVLASFFVANAAVSALVVAAAPAALAAVAGLRPSVRGGLLLAFRLLPTAAALALALGLVAPSYLLFEPVDTGERLTASLALFAAAGLLIALLGLIRGGRAVAATDALARDWSRGAGQVALAAPVQAFRIDEDSPIFAVVGVRRPRLFVSRPVLDVLTPAEIDAAVAHEREHLAARDNLKRLIMRSAPDLVALSSASQAIEREWVRAAEAAADARVSAGGGETALALAASLVKVARLASFPPAGLPISALQDGGDVEARVRWLVRAADESGRGRPTGRELRPAGTGTWIALLAMTAAAVVTAAGYALPTIHRVVELAVRIAR